jgi:hypothetical protein
MNSCTLRNKTLDRYRISNCAIRGLNLSFERRVLDLLLLKKLSGQSNLFRNSLWVHQIDVYKLVL